MSSLRKSTPPQLPAISDAEWLVMREFWARGQSNSSPVLETLAKSQGWKPATVQTLISRLVKKGALGFERHGREYLYSPLVQEDQCRHNVSRNFVDRVFEGKLAPLLACFMEREKISAKELAELRSILDEGGAK